jgi:predicted metal-dependent hydrolase
VTATTAQPTTTQPATSKRAFKQRVHTWAQKLEVPMVGLAVRPMATKWASCSSNGHLSFSTDLLCLDPALWDYVIVHELLHLSVPNHGKLFKALLRAHLGDWERAAARLQEHARSAAG